jgi:hypothetical protein
MKWLGRSTATVRTLDERRILRMSIAHTPYPDPTLPVIAPTAEPVNRAFAQSGQTSRSVIVFSKGSLTLRSQSGQSRADSPIATSRVRLLRRVRRRRTPTQPLMIIRVDGGNHLTRYRDRRS